MITPPQTLLPILGHQQTLVSRTSQIPLLWLVQESPTGLKSRLPHFLAIPVLHSISRHHILLLYLHSYDPLRLNGTIMSVYLPQSEPTDWTSRCTRQRSLIRVFVAQRPDHQRNRQSETDVALPIWQQTLCVWNSVWLTEQPGYSDPWISKPLPSSLYYAACRHTWITCLPKKIRQ